MKKVAGLILVALLSTIGVAGSAAGSTSGTACGGEDDVQTLNLVLRPARTTYGVGDTLVVKAHVTRGDDRVSRTAAEGVTVTMQLANEDVVLGSGAVTDATGTAALKLRVPRHAPEGLFDVQAYARKTIASAPCFRRDEFGKFEADGFLRVDH